MRKFIALFVLSGGLLIAAGFPAVQAEDRFLSVIEDLPLMSGLMEIESSAVVFDKADGRIVQISATGAVTAAQVRVFYTRTLPQLGWAVGPDGSWQRDREILTITPVKKGRSVEVEFSLHPASAKP